MQAYEVKLLLSGDLDYYTKLIENSGGELVLDLELHDLYFSSEPFQNLVNFSDEQIENKSVKLRGSITFDGIHFYGNEEIFYFENLQRCPKFIDSEPRLFIQNEAEINEYKMALESFGWYNIIDTFSTVHTFKLKQFEGNISISEVDNIGLILTYSNPDYEDLPSEVTRQRLIDDLNEIGFEFNYKEQDVEKLKTLLLGTLCLK